MRVLVSVCVLHSCICVSLFTFYVVCLFISVCLCWLCTLTLGEPFVFISALILSGSKWGWLTNIELRIDFKANVAPFRWFLTCPFKITFITRNAFHKHFSRKSCSQLMNTTLTELQNNVKISTEHMMERQDDGLKGQLKARQCSHHDKSISQLH